MEENPNLIPGAHQPNSAQPHPAQREAQPLPPPHAQPSITLSRAPDLPASQLRAPPGPLVSPVRPAFPGPLASRSARTTHARSAAFSLTSQPRLSAPPPRSPH